MKVIKKIVEMLLKATKIDINVKANDGNTALMNALLKGHKEIAQMLSAFGTK